EAPVVEPLPWDDPDEDRPQLDPVVLDDPERWGGPSWPDPPDRPGSQVRPPDRYEPSTLDDDIRRARARAAALADELARARRQADPAEPTDPTHSGPATDPHSADDARWDRFVDESVPTVRIWAARRRV